MARKVSEVTKQRYYALCKKLRRDRRQGIEQKIRYYFILFKVGSVPKWVFDSVTPNCNLDQEFQIVMGNITAWRAGTKGRKVAPVDVKPTSMELQFQEEHETPAEDPSGKYREMMAEWMDTDMKGMMQALADLLDERDMMISYFKKIDTI